MGKVIIRKFKKIAVFALCGGPRNVTDSQQRRRRSAVSRHDRDENRQAYVALVKSLTNAIKMNEMGLVANESATVGAKSIGKTIPGNMVIMVFRPDFAIRMLKASAPAGIEAPIRYYITEDPATGKATLTYRTPSSVFGPYKNAKLDAMTKELDVIFAKIASDATK